MEKHIITTLQTILVDYKFTDAEILTYILLFRDFFKENEFIDEEMNTLLHWSAKTNRLELCSMLLNSMIDININPHTTNMQGKTVLHISCIYGNTRMVVLLLSKIPSLLQMIDHTNHTAFYYAVTTHHFTLAMLLHEQFNCSWFTPCETKQKQSLIQCAISKGDWKCFTFLLQVAGNQLLFFEDSSKRNAFLTSACTKSGTKDIAMIWNYLMKHYLQQMISSRDHIGRNIFHFACLESNHCFVELCNEYLIAASTTTIIKHSLFCKKKHTQKWLEHLCFTIDTVFQQCPLSIAISKGDCKMVQLFLPCISNWNDKRFAPCVSNLLDDIHNTSLMLQFVLTQILSSSSNPTSAPLANLVAIAKMMILNGAKLGISVHCNFLQYSTSAIQHESITAK